MTNSTNKSAAMKPNPPKLTAVHQEAKSRVTSSGRTNPSTRTASCVRASESPMRGIDWAIGGGYRPPAAIARLPAGVQDLEMGAARLRTVAGRIRRPGDRPVEAGAKHLVAEPPAELRFVNEPFDRANE